MSSRSCQPLQIVRASSAFNLDLGIYTVEATYFGLHAEQKVTIEEARK